MPKVLIAAREAAKVEDRFRDVLTSAGLGCVWAWIHPTRTRT